MGQKHFNSTPLFLFILLVCAACSAVSLCAEDAGFQFTTPFAAFGRSKLNTDLNTGSANFSISIDIPLGRGKVTPQLALSYSSVNGNGWCGVGWDMPVGYVQRDLRKSVPRYDDTDGFTALIYGSAFELAKAGGSLYRPMIEGQFIKFSYDKDKNYWVAVDRDGRRFTFGLSAASRVSGRAGIFRWYLEKIADIHGNTARLFYSTLGLGVYLSRIDYSGHEAKNVSAPYSVYFNWEKRDDVINSYRIGFRDRITYRLNSIEIKFRQELLRRYLLEYDYSPQVKNSRLRKITQFGADNKTSFPPLQFSYSSAQGIVTPASLPEPDKGNNLWKISYAEASLPSDDKIAYPVYDDSRATGNIGDTYIKWRSPVIDRDYDNPQKIISWHQNSDGSVAISGRKGVFFDIWTYVYVQETQVITLPLETHLACFQGGSLITPRYNPVITLRKGINLIEFTGYFTDSRTVSIKLPLAQKVDVMNSELYKLSSPVGDYNGDGILDIAIYDNVAKSFSVALSGEGGFTEYIPWITGFDNDYVAPTPLSGDFNADGKCDVALTDGNSFMFAFSDGSQFVRQEGVDFTISGGEIPFISDSNADGIPEISAEYKQFRYDGWSKFYQYDGTTFAQVDSVLFKKSSEGVSSIYGGDFNGDGLTDIGIMGINSDYRKTWDVILAQGTKDYQGISFLGSPDSITQYDNPYPGTQWLDNFSERWANSIIADFNNDGRTDIGYLDYGTGDWNIALSDGTQFIPSGAWVRNFGRGNSWAAIAADFNGDGLTDAALVNGIDKTKIVIAYAKGTKADLLTEINNGMGGRTLISYTPAVNYQNKLLPFPVQTVSAVTVSDGVGNSYTTKYGYSGGYYDMKSREFRGFAYVKMTSPEGAVQETWIKQDDIFKGKIERQVVSDINGKVYSKAENDYLSKEIAPGINFPYLYETRSYSYAGDDSVKVSAARYAYDEYGNVTETKHLGDIFLTGDERSEVTEYVYNLDKWILNRPKHTFIKDAQERKEAETFFYYDGKSDYNLAPLKGDLTVTERKNYTGEDSLEQSVYDDFGNIIRKIDPRQNTTIIEYDPVCFQFPVKVTNALKQIESFEYDYRFQKVKNRVDVNGNFFRVEFDALGRELEEYGPGKDVLRARYTYDLEHFPVSTGVARFIEAGKPDSLAETVFYDGLGRKLLRKSPAEDSSQQIVKEAFLYDSQGNVIYKTLPYFVKNTALSYTAPDFNQPLVKFQYDCLNRLTRTLNADGSSPYTIYSGWDELFVDENSHSRKVFKDAYGNIAQVSEYNSASEYKTIYKYDTRNNLVKIIDSKGNIFEFIYDSLGRKKRLSDPDMGSWSYDYDRAGNIIQQIDSLGNVIKFEYDPLNRAKRKFSLAGGVENNLAQYIYDDKNYSNSVGRLSKAVYPEGADEYFYDSDGSVVKETRLIAGSSFTTRWEYDLLKRLKKLIYPDNEEVVYSYNSQGVIESIKGNKEYLRKADYNASSQITTQTFGNSVNTAYVYNPLNLRLENLKTTSVSFGVVQNLTYKFDKAGNVAKISDAITNLSQDFKYDDLNRLAYAKGAYGELGYSYDSIGNMLNKGSFALTYGEGGMPAHALTSLNNGVAALKIDYDRCGNMLTDGNSRYAYDRENRLSSVNALPTVLTNSFTFTLAPGWNFISFPVIPGSDNLDAVLSNLAIGSDYDEVLRLRPADSAFEGYFHNDKFNQFKNVEPGRGYEIYVTNPKGVTFTVSGSAIDAQAGIFLAKGQNLVGLPVNQSMKLKDAFAGLTKGTHYSDIYGFDDQSKSLVKLTDESVLYPGKAYIVQCLKDVLWRIPQPAAQPVKPTTFAYDAEGNRIKKTDSGGTIIYAGEHYEVNSTGAVKYIFMGNTRVCSVVSSSVRYYHPDHLGSTSLITNEAGNVTERDEYQPYGEFISGYPNPPPSSLQPITRYYTGKELDTSTGLYYYGARYYNPLFGRFTQADTQIPAPYNPQSLNRYAYCLNNPLRYVDPAGNSALDVVKGFFGAAFDAIKGIVMLQQSAEATGNAIAQFILHPKETAQAVGESFRAQISTEAGRDELIGSGIFMAATFFIPGGEGGGVVNAAEKAKNSIPVNIRKLAEANIKNSGKTVLGHYPGYIGKAERIGASYFDLGEAWNYLSGSERAAANEHFLDLVAAKGDQIYLSNSKVNINPISQTAKEIKYLMDEKNYKWLNQWSLKK